MRKSTDFTKIQFYIEISAELSNLYEILDKTESRIK